MTNSTLLPRCVHIFDFLLLLIGFTLMCIEVTVFQRLIKTNQPSNMVTYGIYIFGSIRTDNILF